MGIFDDGMSQVQIFRESVISPKDFSKREQKSLGKSHNPGTKLSNFISFGIRSSKGSVALVENEGIPADEFNKEIYQD